MTRRRMEEGSPEPLGATLLEDGVNFAVFSEVADQIDLCVFDPGRRHRFPLPGRTGAIHHGRLRGAKAGLRYGYRVHGPWDPGNGQRCNPAKLLLDPYARRIVGEVRWHPSVYDYDPRHPLRAETTDSARYVPRSLVVDVAFDWQDDHPPAIPWDDTVIYETHVKGITRLHPDVPAPWQGTYSGLTHRAVVDHLRRIGVTAVELLPISHFPDDQLLVDRGLHQYWGYQPIGLFAPHARYASTDDPVTEFKEMVRALHGAGLEVILDVVYNHTAEGDHRGPTLCFRGFDNRAYYRLDPHDASRYVDVTGTGNTVNVGHPQVLRLVLDSLRHWVKEMRVDGFRFDLAVTLGRHEDAFDSYAPFFREVAADPILSGVKLIAEPWDLGQGGYQVGGFPPGWSEWNGRFRDEVRDFWRGEGAAADLARRVAGSPDLYPPDRGTASSINLVTAHDGLTLADLVSYDHRHNESNGEHGRDGDADNRSWNSGVEGPTDDPGVLETRRRRSRALLATLLLSRGTPMLLGGDELGRSQRGNNNGYCQDNEISWYHWDDAETAEFVAGLSELRRSHPAARAAADHLPIGTYALDGNPGAEAQAVAIHLPHPEEDLLVLFNPTPETVSFSPPSPPADQEWDLLLASDGGTDMWAVGPWSVQVLGNRLVVPTNN